MCEDFDLCIPCLVNMRHGHNPHHPFEVAVSRIKLEPEVAALCAPGRNVAHAALCDGCDKVRGVITVAAFLSWLTGRVEYQRHSPQMPRLPRLGLLLNLLRERILHPSRS